MFENKATSIKFAVIGYHNLVSLRDRIPTETLLDAEDTTMDKRRKAPSLIVLHDKSYDPPWTF